MTTEERDPIKVAAADNAPAPEANYRKMSPAEMLQSLGMAGDKWADAFLQIGPSIDRDTMIGWFANAIMAGWDAAKQQTAKQAPEPPLVAIPEEQLQAFRAVQERLERLRDEQAQPAPEGKTVRVRVAVAIESDGEVMICVDRDSDDECMDSLRQRTSPSAAFY